MESESLLIVITFVTLVLSVLAKDVCPKKPGPVVRLTDWVFRKRAGCLNLLEKLGYSFLASLAFGVSVLLLFLLAVVLDERSLVITCGVVGAITGLGSWIFRGGAA